MCSYDGYEGTTPIEPHGDSQSSATQSLSRDQVKNSRQGEELMSLVVGKAITETANLEISPFK